MNQPWAFFIISLGHFLIAFKLIVMASSMHPGIYWMAAVIAMGLGFDNSVLAFGQRLMIQKKLLAMSRIRYLLHAAVTPLLLPLAFYTAQLGGLQLSDGITILAWLVTGAWILSAWNYGFGRLELEVVQNGNLVRHHNKSRSGQPWLRLMLVVVVIVILIVGNLAGAETTRVAMTTGGMAMLIGAMSARTLGLGAANTGELVLMASLTVALVSRQ